MTIILVNKNKGLFKNFKDKVLSKLLELWLALLQVKLARTA